MNSRSRKDDFQRCRSHHLSPIRTMFLKGQNNVTVIVAEAVKHLCTQMKRNYYVTIRRDFLIPLLLLGTFIVWAHPFFLQHAVEENAFQTQLRAQSKSSMSRSDSLSTTFARNHYREVPKLSSVELNISTHPPLAITTVLNNTRHKHAIPNILTFTHAHNLLTEQFTLENVEGDNETQKQSTLVELQTLQRNVRDVIALHPGAQVRFLTDADCVESIRRVMNYKNTMSTSIDDAELVYYFENEKKGMFRADLCRGVALYETGGLYFDVDLGVRMNLWNVLNKNTTFCTIRVHRQSKNIGGFFQAFMAVAPRHPIIYRYIELFLDYYRGLLPEYRYKPLGVVLLRRAYEDIVGKDYYRTEQSKKIEETIELWQEMLYRFDWQTTLLQHVPAPVNSKRACKFIVISDVTTDEKNNLKKDSRPEITNLTVPFYSRIVGSRMCPKPSLLDSPQQKKKKVMTN